MAQSILVHPLGRVLALFPQAVLCDKPIRPEMFNGTSYGYIMYAAMQTALSAESAEEIPTQAITGALCVLLLLLPCNNYYNYQAGLSTNQLHHPSSEYSDFSLDLHSQVTNPLRQMMAV